VKARKRNDSAAGASDFDGSGGADRDRNHDRHEAMMT
jgi:hypothetical protein